MSGIVTTSPSVKDAIVDVVSIGDKISFGSLVAQQTDRANGSVCSDDLR